MAQVFRGHTAVTLKCRFKILTLSVAEKWIYFKCTIQALCSVLSHQFCCMSVLSLPTAFFFSFVFCCFFFELSLKPTRGGCPAPPLLLAAQPQAAFTAGSITQSLPCSRTAGSGFHPAAPLRAAGTSWHHLLLPAQLISPLNWCGYSAFTLSSVTCQTLRFPP